MTPTHRLNARTWRSPRRGEYGVLAGRLSELPAGALVQIVEERPKIGRALVEIEGGWAWVDSADLGPVGEQETLKL